MRITIAAGGVEISIEGVAYNRRQVTELLGEVAGIAIALEDAGIAPTEPEPAPRQFGFRLGADTELAEIIEPDLSEYFEEEEDD
ncbi:hypothetical protein UFOVP199_18 [uncultured Caudovirales phage]|uniref:Uncharacterized protein n=1 Tax=uncultured Caudovirales phage TaxID=2100421 RepID=A0A6J7WIK4_9CAUD|nr:hypothetical protein UFOVP199_18 [uncultured Caudovirales phage]